MGQVFTTIGDYMTWFRTYQNVEAVNGTLATGTDLDDVVLEALT